MNAKKIIVPFVNLLIFTGAGVALYCLGNAHSFLFPPNKPAEQPTVATVVPVSVATVARQSMSKTIVVYGQVEPAPAAANSPSAAISVSAPSTAMLQELQCSEGQTVRAGDVLFVLDTRAADADIAHAQAALASGQSALDKLRNAANPADFPAWAVLIAQWQLESAQAGLNRAIAAKQLLSITAPISGIVRSVHVQPGEVTAAGATVVDLIDPSRRILALDVPGFLLESIKAGQPVLLDDALKSPPASTTQPAGGNPAVLFVDPKIDPATGMAVVDASAPSSLLLSPGKFVRAQIVVEQHPNCLVVPAECIVQTPTGESQIAIVSKNRRAILTRVELGIRQGDRVEVKADGLSEGDTVVTTGASALVSQTNIEIIGGH